MTENALTRKSDSATAVPPSAFGARWNFSVFSRWGGRNARHYIQKIESRV
jgi:hypothetical protein